MAGELTKSYQYSPWGERLSQVKHNSDGTSEDGFYGYNGHTDVETVTGGNGDTKATYGYTAYGSDDEAEFTGIDKPDATDPTKEAYNPYRFNAKRWDAQSGTYDMGFRDYNPGLNRFTTRDMYNGALSDMGLGSDPYTGNRYAFTGGNPVSVVELDGHRPVECNEAGYTCRMNDAGGWDVSATPTSTGADSTMVDRTPDCSSYGYQVKDACMAAGVMQMTQEHLNLIKGADGFDTAGRTSWSDWDAFLYLIKQTDVFAYKASFVSQYGDVINAAAKKYDLPAHLLAGVVYNEVGGDPPSADDAKNILTGDLNTSFGEVSMQVDTAADLLGYDSGNLTQFQKSKVIESLKDPAQNIFIAARYLSVARDKIAGMRSGNQLTSTDVKNVGAYYNGGPDYYATDPDAQQYGQLIVDRQGMLEGMIG